MTVQFNCPHCGALIAFADKHVGKRARCNTCGQRFIIPSKSGETPEKAEQPQEEGQPIPGFYRAVFIDSWKLFVRPQNAAGLVFVAAAVCFKFFTGHTDYSFTMGAFRFQAPTGLVITLAAWGCLFWYYMEIICSTALDGEELPDADVGGFFGFIWNAIVSLFVFARAMVVVLLPSAMYLAISRKADFVWYTLVHIGLFAFPMAILTFSLGRDVGIRFRRHQILKAVTKAFWPYLVVFGLFALAWELQLRTLGYGRLLDAENLVIGLHLMANLAVQVIAIVAMRSIGLFYRHYGCHFPQ
jgi:DNA-directed RNA polymerase subunit RPC12/RpoP